jgi:hypothetical protein
MDEQLLLSATEYTRRHDNAAKQIQQQLPLISREDISQIVIIYRKQSWKTNMQLCIGIEE